VQEIITAVFFALLVITIIMLYHWAARIREREREALLPLRPSVPLKTSCERCAFREACDLREHVRRLEAQGLVIYCPYFRPSTF